MSERNWEKDYYEMFRAAAESGKAYEEIIAKKNVELAALREQVRVYEEFTNDVSETLELHESHWNYHLHKDMAELAVFRGRLANVDKSTLTLMDEIELRIGNGDERWKSLREILEGAGQ